MSQLRAEKSHYYPTPCTALWGEAAKGCFLCSPEDLLSKHVNYTHIIIKRSLKIMFLWKIPETKKFSEKFWEAFLIFFKKYVA
jgi:hypothetical protein